MSDETETAPTTAVVKLAPPVIRNIQSASLTEAAKLAVQSGYYTAGCKNASQVMAKMARGEELGIGRIAALEGIAIIQGKLAMSAVLMAGVAKSKGYKWAASKWTASECILEFYDKTGFKLGEASFSMEDAKAAGLVSNPTWKKFPKSMLMSRALTLGLRAYCQDAFLGASVYLGDEIPNDEVETDEEGNLKFKPISSPAGSAVRDKVINLFYQLTAEQQENWLKLQGLSHVDDFQGGSAKVVKDLESMLEDS